jgi:hypothetical protein
MTTDLSARKPDAGLVEAVNRFMRSDVIGLIVAAGQRFPADDPVVLARPLRFIPAGLEGAERAAAIAALRTARLEARDGRRFDAIESRDAERRRRLERLADRRRGAP